MPENKGGSVFGMQTLELWRDHSILGKNQKSRCIPIPVMGIQFPVPEKLFPDTRSEIL